MAEARQRPYGGRRYGGFWIVGWDLIKRLGLHLERAVGWTPRGEDRARLLSKWEPAVRACGSPEIPAVARVGASRSSRACVEVNWLRRSEEGIGFA